VTLRRPPLLLYHSVADAVDPRFAEWAVTPELFAAHMELLAGEGYCALTVREFVEHTFKQREPLPPRSVVITFDDGFADFHSLAWPVLRRNSLTATVFVATGFVGRTSSWLADLGEGDRPMLSWPQIEEVASAGIELGAHGHRHLQLDTVPESRAGWDIARSKRALEAAVGTVSSFAFPHGYYTSRLRRQVARAGFSSACAVKDALSSTREDRFALARVVVRGSTDEDAFARLLRGEHVSAAPRAGPLRRGAWRAVRRAGGEPIATRIRELL
jgi:peptidoglycan/xylan/chitin deacetylase (PgdA/CDA1 family)